MNTTKERYLIKLISYGGELNSEYSKNAWHPAKWQTYRGDLVRVFDTLTAEWLPDYRIEKDGE